MDQDKRLTEASTNVTSILAARRNPGDAPLPSEMEHGRVIAEFLESFYITTDPEERSGLYVCCNYCNRLGNEWVGSSCDGIDVAKVLFDHFVEEHLNP